MPTDTRRLPVPDESFSPLAFSSDFRSKRNKLLCRDENTKRSDGRLPDDIRPIFTEAGIISQAKGSAYIELENTKVICAVYGPREVKKREEFSLKGQLSCEFKFATFSCEQRQQHQQSPLEKLYSGILEEALAPAVRLEKFPKARLDVFITVLQNDGSALAAAITCASVALTDANVEMYDLVVGSSLSLKDNVSVADPKQSEEFSSQLGESSLDNGSMTVGFLPNLQQVATIHMKGEFSSEVVSKCIKQCVDTCHRIYPAVEQCLMKSIKKKLMNKNATERPEQS